MQDFCKNNRALAAKKYAGLFLPKVGRSHHSFGDLMREATRLSRICFISLISPRKKLAVSLSLRERLFLILRNDYFERNRRRKNLPARWWSRQEF